VNLEPKTRLGYLQILAAHLLPEFGTRKVSTITTQRVQTYVKQLQDEGLAAGTVRNIFATLRTSLNAGVRLRMIAVNPCTGVKVPRPRQTSDKMLFLTPEEINALADAISHPVIQSGPHEGERKRPGKQDKQARVLVLTAAYTGMRAGELLALRRKDINVLSGRIHVARALKEICGKETESWPDDQKGMVFGPTKNHLNRSIAIPRFLTEILNAHMTSSALSSGAGPDALIFPDVNGEPLRHHNFYRRQFKPAVLRALPPEKHGLRFHDLRHTAASMLIAAGVHAKAIQERLGHSSITVTMDRYGHLMESAHKGLTDALEAAYTSASTEPKDEVVQPIRKAQEA
jgi:integrase